MIIRVALFLTLLAVFYHYCNEDNASNKFRGPNDINMIEVPNDISPSFIEKSDAVTQRLIDSTFFLSSDYSIFPKPNSRTLPETSPKN